MKISKILGYTTAITLVLASPQIASAKAVHAELASNTGSVRTANELLVSTKNWGRY